MKLIFTASEFEGQSCELRDGKYRVGRAPDNWIVILDPSVSSHHCEIEVNGPEIIVREQDSANGTWIGDSRVTTQAQARHGQMIRFGAVSARVELPPPSEDHVSDVTAVNMHLDMLKEEHRRQNQVQPKPQRVVIRPHAADMPQGQTIAMPGIQQHVKPAPEVVSAAPTAGKSRAVLICMAVIAAGLLYALWRYKQGR